MTQYKSMHFFYTNCSNFAAVSASARTAEKLDTAAMAVSILITCGVRPELWPVLN